MADGVWKMADGVKPQVIGHYKQLLVYKFLDSGTPSMRKGRSGDMILLRKKMMELVATNVVTS